MNLEHRCILTPCTSTQNPGPRNDKDATQYLARDLAELASHIAQLKGEVRAYS